MDLFPYQVQDGKWLSEQTRALLCHEMGVGKSAIAITACDILKVNKILVLCPSVAKYNWLREFDKFSKIKRAFKIIEKSSDISLDENFGLVICSHTMAADHYVDFLCDYDVIILDEVHFLKNPTAKRTLNILGIKGIIHGQKCKTRIWALSGTPAPNHAGELWAILRSFGATSLGYDGFVQWSCNEFKSSFGLQITGTKKSRIPEIREILSKANYLRRTKVDVNLQLPPLTFQDVFIEARNIDDDLELDPFFIKWVFPSDRRKELREKLDKEISLVENTITGRNGLEILGGLAKSVSTLRMYIGIQKASTVAKMVKEELTNKLYDKIVIFAVHQSVIEGLRRELKEFNPVTLYGGTNAEKAQKNIDKFQTNASCKVFIGNIQACGTAITLTAAHQVLFAELDWVPGNNAQASMRCHRIGQTHPVTVRKVIALNSIDEKVASALKKKSEELTLLYDGVKQFPSLLKDLI